MKILLLHAREFGYETREKAVKHAPDPPGSYECSNCLVVLTTIEDGDDEYALIEATDNILDVAKRVSAQIIVIYPYAHLSSRLAKPDVAHPLLVRLASILSTKSDNMIVHRAPFGWYKRFKIDVYGHPLSELSREIRGEGVLYATGEELITLDDAIKKGYLPKGLETMNYDDELLDVLRRFGLVELNDEGLYMINKMIDMMLYSLGGSFGSINMVSEGISHTTGIKAVKELIHKCHNITPRDKVTILLGREPKETLIMITENIDLQSITRNISRDVSDLTTGIHLGEDKIVVGSERLTVKLHIYKSYNGDLKWPLGIYIKHVDVEKTCIGPVYNLIVSLIHSELVKAKHGKTPMIPIWIHPYHAAVVPVSDSEVELAREVIDRLVQQSVRVYPLLNVKERLGARIRAAARKWIPYIIVIGRREAETGTLTVRRRWQEGKQEAVTIEELLEELRVVAANDPAVKRLILE